MFTKFKQMLPIFKRKYVEKIYFLLRFTRTKQALKIKV